MTAPELRIAFVFSNLKLRGKKLEFITFAVRLNREPTGPSELAGLPEYSSNGAFRSNPFAGDRHTAFWQNHPKASLEEGLRMLADRLQRYFRFGRTRERAGSLRRTRIVWPIRLAH